MIVIDEIGVGTGQLPGSAIAFPDQTLVQKASDNGWTSDLEAPVERVPEADYLKYLRDLTERLTTTLDVSLPKLKPTSAVLREALANEDYSSFDYTWSQQQSLVWNLVAASYGRGLFDFTTPAPDYSTQGSARAVVDVPATGPDSSAYYYVGLSGPRDALFFYASQQVRPFAQRCAQALAYNNKSDLLQIVKYLELAGENDPAPLRLIQAAVDKERTLYERIQIRGHFGNTGNSAFSVLNDGALFVYLAGYEYAADGSQRKQSTDVQLPMIVGNETGNYDDSLLVGAGSAVRFVATSDKPIRLLADAVALRTALNAERHCQFGILMALPGHETLSINYSGRYPFRNLRRSVPFGRPPGVGRRLAERLGRIFR